MDVAQLYMFAVACVGLSITFRDNPGFRWVEAMVQGALAGNFVVVGLASFQSTVWTPLTTGTYLMIIPLAVALLQFTAFTRYRWPARYPVAIAGGAGVGLAIRAAVQTEIVAQILTAIKPLNTVDWGLNGTNLIFMVTVALTLFYFMFGFQLKGRWATLNRVARLFILLGLGAQAGSTFAVQGNAQTWYVILDYLKKGLGI